MNLDWNIIYVSNGHACDKCGKYEMPYVDYICDAHTDGLNNAYGHTEIRLVLDLGAEEIMRILNTIGLRISQGESFKAGDLIHGIYEDCDVRVDWIDEEDEMKNALRIVIPDSKNRFPEDPKCDEIYALQKYKLKDLQRCSYIS